MMKILKTKMAMRIAIKLTNSVPNSNGKIPKSGAGGAVGSRSSPKK